uniref:Uncharacterized protein n=1 Tax=Arundo donax TaxID=35708 RepID=A0A0A9D6S2_ARUDO
MCHDILCRMPSPTLQALLQLSCLDTTTDRLPDSTNSSVDFPLYQSVYGN